MPANQTLSFLTRRFQEIGIHPDTRHGQNFLIDQNLLRVLVETAQPGKHDVVLEVGTGTGGLTVLLAQSAAAVVTVEIARPLFELASEQLLGFDNVTMLHQDALAGKNRMDPRVMHAVERHLDAQPGRQWKLIANLPYNIATPVLSNLLAESRVPTTMTVTIQKELADRIAASPRTKDYGALSLWIQSQCQVRIVRVLPPSVFWPRPKVHSAIVHIALDWERRGRIPNLPYWHRFVRAVFLHRRKFLRGVLLATFKRYLSKSDIDEVLAEAHLEPTSRAEELDVATMLALCETVRARASDWRP